MAKTGVVILAHGSRDRREAGRLLEEISHRVKARLDPGVTVMGVVTQLNHPDLAEAVNTLIRQGTKRILIMPCCLFEDTPPIGDIIENIEGIKQVHPNTEFVLANTLGTDEILVDPVVRRMVETAPELFLPQDAAVLQLTPTEIESRSMEIIDGLLPPLACSDKEREVIKRIVHAAGDFQIARLVRFHPRAVPAGITAIRAGEPIFTDVKMLAAGINRRLAEDNGGLVGCVIDEPEVARRAQLEGTTRSAASVRHLGSRLNGAIVAIGNAPTALLTLLDLIDSENITPALVVGMPVGFVKAGESKAGLMEWDVPYITIEGNRGGSAMAAATVNALMKLAR
jgi:precorrin-8X/cobalt-precorrin-8 methylmutase